MICNYTVTTGTEYYILGTYEKIDLDIAMSNSGEDSYLTSLNVTLPTDVSYVNVELVGEQCIPVACTQVSFIYLKVQYYSVLQHYTRNTTLSKVTRPEVTNYCNGSKCNLGNRLKLRIYR